jgi:hypothetical protein
MENYSVRGVQSIMYFYLRNFHVLPAFWEIEIFFDLFVYFSFKTTKFCSVNVHSKN